MKEWHVQDLIYLMALKRYIILLIDSRIQTNQRLLKKFQEAKRLRPHKTCAMMLEVRGREIRTTEVDERSAAFVPASEQTNYKSGI